MNDDDYDDDDGYQSSSFFNFNHDLGHTILHIMLIFFGLIAFIGAIISIILYKYSDRWGCG